MKNQEPISKNELNAFLKERGTSINNLFSTKSMYRYTKEGSDLLAMTYEHFTGWKLTPKGLELKTEDQSVGQFVNPNIKSMNDLNSLDAYLENINENRTKKEYHVHLMKQVIEHALELERVEKKHDGEKRELKQMVKDFLKEHQKTPKDIFHPKNQPSKQTHDVINSLVKEFAFTYLNENKEIVLIAPNGLEKIVGSDVNYHHVKNTDQLIEFIKQLKDARDEVFFLHSRFVRDNRKITRQTINQVCQERLDVNIRDLITGKGIDEQTRHRELNQLHFHLSEVHVQGNELVTNVPNNEQKYISFGSEKVDDYYTSIKTLDDFIVRVKQARDARDLIHEKYRTLQSNRIKRITKRKQNIEREDNPFKR